MNPTLIMILGGVLMFIAAAMMVSQGQWVMLAVVVPIWFLILGVWWYRERTR